MPGKNRSRDGKDHAPTSFIRANYVQPPQQNFSRTPMPKPVIAKLLCAPNSSQNCKVTAVQVSYMVFQYLHNFLIAIMVN